MVVSLRPLRSALQRVSPSAFRHPRDSAICQISKIFLSLAAQSFSYKVAMPSRFVRELTIRQLRALAAVQKHRSVTAAAKQLHLTQPAVTLQLRNLQALAGLPLIQRTSDGMLLTDAGREVLALSERIEAAIASCADLARHDGGQDRRAHFDRRRLDREIFRAVRDLRIFETAIRTSTSRCRSATGRKSAPRCAATTSTSPSWAGRRSTST